MRSLVIACGLAAALCGPYLPAQSISDVISSNQRSHDFGAVARASKAEHRFQLYNPFNGNLVIQSVRTSCGCTTAVVEDHSIAPGETGSLLARFNTDRYTGEKKATITVSITQPIRTELQLNVRGYIRTDVVLHPGEAAFGSVPEGSSAHLKMELNYAGRSDWEIRSVTSPFPFIRTEFTELSRGGGRVQYEVSVELKESAPEGFLSNQLVIHTNDKRLKTVPILLTAKVEKPLQTSPSSIALGSVKPNESVAQRVTLTGKSEFTVLDIQCDIADIRFDPPAKASRVHVLRALITPRLPEEFVEGELKGVISVHTDLSDHPIEIPLSYSIETEKLADAQVSP